VNRAGVIYFVIRRRRLDITAVNGRIMSAAVVRVDSSVLLAEVLRRMQIAWTFVLATLNSIASFSIAEH